MQVEGRVRRVSWSGSVMGMDLGKGSGRKGYREDGRRREKFGQYGRVEGGERG